MKSEKELSKNPGVKFLRRHSQMSLLIIAFIAVAVIAAIAVFLWFVADAQATGLVPTALGEWTVGNFFIFVLTLILWELVCVGSWVIVIAGLIYHQGYSKLPDKERKEYEGCKRRKTAEGGGMSFFVWIVWLILVWVNGMWNLPFQEWTFNEWVYTWLAAFLWVLLLIGIPATLFLLWIFKGKE